MAEQRNTLTYRDAGVDIDAGNSLVERIKPAAAATQRAGRDRRARRLRRALRPEGGRLPRPGPGRHDRRRRHQAEDRHRERRARHDRHRPRRHVRQRPRRAGRRAAAFPRLFRHRRARCGGGRRTSSTASRRAAAWPARAGRRRDGGDAGPLSAAATTTSPASRSARSERDRLLAARRSRGRRRRARPRLVRPSFERLFARPPRRRDEPGFAGRIPAPFEPEKSLAAALLDADAHLCALLPRGDPRDRRRQGARPHHRRRAAGERAARAPRPSGGGDRPCGDPRAAGLPLARPARSPSRR